MFAPSWVAKREIIYTFDDGPAGRASLFAGILANSQTIFSQYDLLTNVAKHRRSFDYRAYFAC